MKQRLLFILLTAFSGFSYAQNPKLEQPLNLRNSCYFTFNSLGWQSGVGKTIKSIERHKIKRNGREQIIRQSRVLYANIGFYYQPKLHYNVFLTADYALVRHMKKGRFIEFAPALGISRTQLDAVTYTVNDASEVKMKKSSGDWRLVSGFTWGIGKSLNSKKNYLISDIYLRQNIQLLYPNFRFLAVRPSLMLGCTIKLNTHKFQVKQQVKTINRWHKVKKS